MQNAGVLVASVSHPTRETPGTQSTNPAARAASLEEVLAYTNDDVVDRYIVDFDAESKDAEQIFADLKRWLWLCAEARRDHERGIEVPTITIFDGQLQLDDMWHTFLLFTRDYAEFCFTHFGHYLHHMPTPEREKREHMANPSERQRDATVASKRQLMRDNAAYTFDKLGQEVATRWFLDPPRNAHAGPEGVPPENFHAAYERSAPWETGTSQPQLRRMLRAKEIVGDVLDLGCGSGENAFAMAAAGHQVYAVDFVKKAIAVAQAKQQRNEIEGVHFAEGDALTMRLNREFDTIVDSGVFHAFSDEDRPRYLETIHAHLRPGGHLHVICFSTAEGGYGPRRISKEELQEVFTTSLLEVVDIRRCVYETRSGRKQAWHGVVKRHG